MKIKFLSLVRRTASQSVALVTLAFPLASTGTTPTFSDTNWISMGTGDSGADGRVSVSAVDAAGNLYVAGYFKRIAGVAANGIAKWDGTEWSALGSGIEVSTELGEAIYAMAVSGNLLYVGGKFRRAGGRPVNGIARWNGTNWLALGTGVDVQNGSEVIALAVSGTNLYAGGYFSSISGATASNIARWNGANWSPMGSGLGGFATAAVIAMEPSGNDLYVGGYFSTAGGVAVNHVAKWNGTNWSALGSGMNGSVMGLGSSGGNLYAGGFFTTAGGSPASYIAKWNGSTWSALGTGLDYRVWSLAVSGGNVYAGGQFGSAGGVAASRIARWNGSSWSALGSGLNDIPVWISVIGSDVHASGYFTTAGGRTAKYIAKWNGSGWSVPGRGSSLNGSVTAVALSGDDLYAGGQFDDAGGLPAHNIARWNGTRWLPLGTGLEPVPGYIVLVSALAATSNRVYVAGSFPKAGGVTVNNIACWNGSQWLALGSGVPTGNIFALAASGTDLYAVGNFTAIGGVLMNGVARWNGSAWSALGSGVAPGQSGWVVRAAAVSGNDLYIGGIFASAGGVPATNVAKWNGTAWSALGSGNPLDVVALAASGNTLYTGDVDGDVRKWDGVTWSAPLFRILTESGTRGITSMTMFGNDLYIGGEIRGYIHSNGPVTGISGLAKWDGNTVSGLGSGLNSAVRAMTLSGNTLCVGGDFTTAGGKASMYVAKANLLVAGGRFQNWFHAPAIGIHCTFAEATVGQPYRIQASPSMAPGSWVDLTNFTYTAPVIIRDSSAVSGTHRFFRAISP